MSTIFMTWVDDYGEHFANVDSMDEALARADALADTMGAECFRFYRVVETY